MGRLTFSTRITLVRIVLVPLLVALILADGDVRHAPALAAVVFLLASFTDFVDGYLARRWQQVTSLGNFLDTTADKLLLIGSLRLDEWAMLAVAVISALSALDYFARFGDLVKADR